MMRRLASLALAAGLGLAGIGAARAGTLDGGNYGTVTVTAPAGAVRGFVVLFSRGSAWAPDDQQAADALAGQGAYVVGVDTEAYLARIGGLSETCHHMQGDAEALSHQIERELGSTAYYPPILAGIGQGGRLAESALAEAPPNTVDGAASIDPDAALDPRAHPCKAETAGPALPGFWEVATTPAIASVAAQALAAAQDQRGRVAPRHLQAEAEETPTLLGMIGPHLGRPQYDPRTVADLPLIELPAEHASGLLAVVLSGDGGWRDIDKSIADQLHKQGVSVIGWDCLRYFWRAKTPEQTTVDLARVLRSYAARWHAHHIALIGYSFGADVLPFVYNRLPPELRAQVSLMSLLGFAPTADFEIRVGGWLGLPPSGKALPVATEIARVPPALVQCFYGAEETDTICPAQSASGVTVIRTDGGHHFGGDYQRLAEIILRGWKERLHGA